MINTIGGSLKNKKEIQNLTLDFLKNDSVSYDVYEKIKAMIPDELICEEKAMSSWDKKYTKRMLHKEDNKELIDRLKSFKEKNNLMYTQMAFNDHNDYYLVRTIYKIN